MTSVPRLDPTTFVPPGPGTWLLDAVHVSRPFTRFQIEIHPSNLAQGVRENARQYGLLIDTLDWRFVNGFAYFAVPPAPAEEIPARFQAAERALETKLWREDMARWEREVKPAAIQAHLSLQAIDPKTLSPDELLMHLDRCREHQQRMIRQHHSFTVTAIITVGDFIAHVGEWTDLPVGPFLALTRGAAPESAGSFLELDRLTAAIRHNSKAEAILRSDGTGADKLQNLLSQPGEVGAAAAAYVSIVGYRLLDSLDVGDPYALEMPDVIVNGIRQAVDTVAPASRNVTDEESKRLRDLIPAEHREAFDDLLAEVRFTSKLRDERGLYSEVWAGGLTRRAILAAGERLVQSGRIADPTHLAEASYEEMRALIQGLDGPSSQELSARASYRATYRASDAPPFLGPPPEPPPSLDGLPPAVARLMGATVTAINAVFAGAVLESEPTVVRGIGASPGVVTGTARLIGGPTEFDRLRPGDVLITASTTESFNIVLSMLGAIVTDSGGLLSHAAIVAREFGIPSVVGCRNATGLIADGAQVRVDGTKGEVVVITAGASAM